MTLPCLATYGSLMPGKGTARALEELGGTWSRGIVHGHLSGHGRTLSVTLDVSGPPVPVYLFSSADLPRAWAALDAMEGPDFIRRDVQVETEAGPISAFIYVAAG
ncbi:MAG: gamma-glutamylcyclotransferase family protein [Pseudomonadota bacterium]